MRLRIPRESFLVFPHHQHCMFSLGGLVLPLPVGLFMVSPLYFPVGLVLVLGVDGGECATWRERGGVRWS